MPTPPSSSCTDRVEISLYAQKLKNTAGFQGISDPYAVVTLLSNQPGQQPVILGKTEVIENNLSPQWIKKFEVDYNFSQNSRINVGIYDATKKGKDDKSMGSAIFEVGEVLGTRGNIKAKKLQRGGTLFCRIQKAKHVNRNTGKFRFKLRGIKLKNVDGFFSKSDPFFEVSKHISANGGSSWQVIYRSESIKNNLNPTWKEVTLSMTDLCGGDRNLPILISVFDYESNGKHISMGYFQTNVNALINAKISTAQATADPKMIDTSKAFSLLMKGRNFGSILVAEAVVEGGEENTSNHNASSMPPFSNPTATSTTTSSPSTGYSSLTPMSPSVTPYAQNALSPSVTPYTHYPSSPMASSSSPTFLDYISGGLELQLSVAIDFTGSNGDPRRPGTLHYIDRAGGSLNCYEKALTAVGSIVAKYDTDQRFPMLGFGAKFHGIIHHCFQLGPTAEVQGVKGMLEAYRSIFQSGLTMSGPTVFSEVIQVTSAQARTQQAAASRIGQQVYNILLILTDGAVTDLMETQQAIRAASDAPLSIIIVGIGQADFGGMQYLDDFMSQGGTGRDICQFVEFRRHENNKLSLTQAVLEEIPTQVVDYFMSHGIRPLPAIRGSLMNIMAEESVEDEIDLALDIEDNGNIHVVSGGMTDDTSYGSYNTYAGLTPLAPPGAMSPTYSAPSQANLGVSQANLYSSLSQAHLGYSHANLYAPSAPVDGPSSPSFVAPSAPTPAVFHVRIPPGIMPGQQLQVINPKTQVPMIITVPHGVPPDRVVAVPL